MVRRGDSLESLVAQDLPGDTQVADEDEYHQVRRIVGVFRRKVFTEDMLRALVGKANDVDVLGVDVDA